MPNFMRYIDIKLIHNSAWLFSLVRIRSKESQKRILPDWTLQEQIALIYRHPGASYQFIQRQEEKRQLSPLRMFPFLARSGNLPHGEVLTLILQTPWGKYEKILMFYGSCLKLLFESITFSDTTTLIIRQPRKISTRVRKDQNLLLWVHIIFLGLIASVTLFELLFHLVEIVQGYS